MTKTNIARLAIPLLPVVIVLAYLVLHGFAAGR